MELSYGNERLVGPVGWNNVGRSFDGLVIKFEVPSQSIEGFVTNIAETNTPPSIATPSAVTSVRDSGQLFSGIYYSLHSVMKHIIDAYVFHPTGPTRRSFPYESSVLPTLALRPSTNKSSTLR